MQCFSQRLRLENHPLAAAKWPVVNRPVAVMRKVAQVVDIDLDQFSGERAAHDSMLKKAAKEPRKDCDDVKAHTQMIESGKTELETFCINMSIKFKIKRCLVGPVLVYWSREVGYYLSHLFEVPEIIGGNPHRHALAY
jgi:hypothetical protein